MFSDITNAEQTWTKWGTKQYASTLYFGQLVHIRRILGKETVQLSSTDFTIDPSSWQNDVARQLEKYGQNGEKATNLEVHRMERATNEY